MSPSSPCPAPCRLPAFANLREALLENLIQNILVEASRGEVVLTSRPRIIALPPLSTPRWGPAATRRRLQGPQAQAAFPYPGFLSSRTPTPLQLPRIPPAAVPDALALRSTYSLVMPVSSPSGLPP